MPAWVGKSAWCHAPLTVGRLRLLRHKRKGPMRILLWALACVSGGGRWSDWQGFVALLHRLLRGEVLDTVQPLFVRWSACYDCVQQVL